MTTVRVYRAGLGGAWASSAPSAALVRGAAVAPTVAGVAVVGSATTLRLYRSGLFSGSGQTKVRLYREGLSTVSIVTQVRYYRSGLLTSGVNLAPTVSAGAAQTVESGATITLSGTATDADGVVVSRLWTLNGVTLSTASTFVTTAPVVATDTLINYVYVATDDDGVASSATTQVTVRRAPIVMKNTDGSFTGLVLRQKI